MVHHTYETMKRLEGQSKLTKPIIRLVDIATGRGDTSLLTSAERRQQRLDTKQLKQQLKQETQIYRERLIQTGSEFLEQIRNDPKIPSHVEIDGKTYTMGEGF